VTIFFFDIQTQPFIAMLTSI